MTTKLNRLARALIRDQIAHRQDSLRRVEEDIRHHQTLVDKYVDRRNLLISEIHELEEALGEIE